MSDDGALDRLVPAALVIQARGRADGADDGVAGDFDLVNFFDEVIENVTEVAAAQGVNPCGMSVGVEGATVREVEIFGDFFRTDPSQEVLIDESAIGMAANRAFAGVASGIESCGKLCVSDRGDSVGGHMRVSNSMEKSRWH